ncbi:S8 family serine peptidase [Streptomyces boninensis]|uniref:RCC1 domain-containing protein n=1 Tax=Streptomyces boninensis TaxID=2039455 RepID=UPI003B225B85
MAVGMRRRRRISAAVAALLSATLLPLLHGPAADAAPVPKPNAEVYDYSRVKDRLPGTHAPLPKGFSRHELAVKLKDAKDTAVLRDVLRSHPGGWLRRAAPEPEKQVTERRVRAERRTGRDLPDMNAWYLITVRSGIGLLLAELNALPAVEIAMAQPERSSPAEPLQRYQDYRSPVGAGATPPDGIDADYASSQPGGKGDGIAVTDIEAGGSEVGPYDMAGKTAAGGNHALMVVTDSTVWAWGDNSHGQLGTGNRTGSRIPVQVPGLTGVSSVYAGFDFSVALKNDGTVWVWGDDAQGQIGNGDGETGDRLTPQKVEGLTGVKYVGAGSNHILAAYDDGTGTTRVKAWGANEHGQLGNNTATNRTSPGPVGDLTGVWGLSAGVHHSIARLSSGKVLAWGSNEFGQLGIDSPGGGNYANPQPVPALTDVDLISAGGYHNLVRDAGTVKAWGLNTSGQVGDDSVTKRIAPVAVKNLSGVSALSAGAFHSMARRDDKKIVTWGYNKYGQLGTGDTTNRDVPTPGKAPDGLYPLAAGYRFSLGVSPDRSVRSWGDNAFGQLGNDSTTAAKEPVQAANQHNRWNQCHEELANKPASAGGPPVPLRPMLGSKCSTDAHGTAVVGVMSAQDDNGVGLAGIAPHARLQLNLTASGDSDGGAILHTLQTSRPGDVILLELQTGLGAGAVEHYPVEYYPITFQAIQTATYAYGVTVVEAAGNGTNNVGNDLSDETDPYAKAIMDQGDSGAIIVGAGHPGTTRCGTQAGPERTPTNYTNYGKRVDLQAYGRCVATLGVPGAANNLPDGTQTDPNKMYLGTFTGTSAASPIVTGAVVALQGVAKQTGDGTPLTPTEVRDILTVTGTNQPEPSATDRPIGPQPDLKRAIKLLRIGRG